MVFVKTKNGAKLIGNVTEQRSWHDYHEFTPSGYFKNIRFIKNKPETIEINIHEVEDESIAINVEPLSYSSINPIFYYINKEEE